MRFARPAAALAMAALLLAPAGAGAQPERLYNDYRADGAINACAYSADSLSAALGDIPADVRAYDPGFAEALNLALDQHVGGCSQPQPSDEEAGAGVVVGSDGSPGPANPRPVRAESGAEEPGLPFALVATIALLGAAVALAAMLGLGRYLGRDVGRPFARLDGATRRAGRRLADGIWALRERVRL
jgi:hypothetical protein